MKKHLLILLVFLFSLLFLMVACGGDTPKTSQPAAQSTSEMSKITTSPTTTQTATTTAPITTTPITTAPITTTPITTTTITTTTPLTTTPETKPDESWKEKIEEGFYENTYAEDGKYYLYLTYSIDFEPDAPIFDDKSLIKTLLPDPSDALIYAEDDYWISETLLLRATKETVEALAKNSYVDGIFAYHKGQTIDGYRASFVRVDGGGDYYPPKLWEEAENSEVPFPSEVRPLLLIESAAELSAFMTTFADTFYLNESREYGEISFAEAVAPYNEDYFKEKALFLVGLYEGSGSIRHCIMDIFVKDSNLSVFVGSKRPQACTADLSFWFGIIEMDKSALASITEMTAIAK